jgi:hypothetical protein
MVDLVDYARKKPVFVATASGAGIMVFVIFMIILGAIFPDQFERMGLGLFLNRKSGVFADCYSIEGRDIPACRNQEIKDKENRLLNAPPRTDSILKEKIVPFTFN